MSVTDKLAAELSALLSFAEFGDIAGKGRTIYDVKADARKALADYEATPKGEVKSNKEWREECQLLRASLRACMTALGE